MRGGCPFKSCWKIQIHIFCRNVSELFWSPAGRNIILAGLAGTQGALEFFNVDDMSTLRLQQHFMCNNVKWDQTGRYACTWVDAHRDMDHGYVMWSFTGEMLYRCAPAPLDLGTIGWNYSRFVGAICRMSDRTNRRDYTMSDA